MEEPTVSRGNRSGVVGILLAAGESRRFGDSNKLLTLLEGEALVRHSALTLVRSRLDRVLVVVGYEEQKIRWTLQDLELEFVSNPAFAEGQSTSVLRGLRRAREWPVDAALFALADMPFVRPSTVNRLVRRYRRHGTCVVLPVHEGTRGNPVLFDRSLWRKLERVEGDKGGRTLLETHPVDRLEVEDPGVLRDVDRPGDLPIS